MVNSAGEGQPVAAGAELAANESPLWLLDFRANVYSQTGEDGIIAKILETLPQLDGWCVEFGAWDGKGCSNTRCLIENRGYSAVLIEGDETRFDLLQKNYADNPKVVTIKQYVGFGQADRLDRILERTPIPRDFDFLSIDIDGNDYHVWKALSEYLPKVVCIEFNPTIPTEVRFVQPSDPAVNQGSGLLSLVELGKSKGYELVSVLAFNAFFVRSELFPLFRIRDNRPLTLRTNFEYITYVFSGFDGSIHLSGNQTLPWHHCDLKESRMQRLPRFLRRYPMQYGLKERALLLLITDPRAFFRELARRVKKTFAVS